MGKSLGGNSVPKSARAKPARKKTVKKVAATKTSVKKTSVRKTKRAPKKVTKRASFQLPGGSIEGPEWRDGELYLSKLDLANYDLAQMRVRNVSQDLRLNEAAGEREHLRHTQEVHRLRIERKLLEQATRDHQGALLSLQKQLGEIYEVPIEVLTYDDQTGKVFLHGDPVKEVATEGD